MRFWRRKKMDNNLYDNQVNTETYNQAVPVEEPNYLSLDTDYNAAAVNENFVAGVIGAFLLSLLGGALYFGLYQVGFIAGICGLVIFWLANFGYGKFSGNKNSKKGVIVSVILMVVIILLSEFACLAYVLYDVAKSEGYALEFSALIEGTMQMLGDSEVFGEVVGDVIFALVFGAIAAFANIKGAWKNAKKAN